MGKCIACGKETITQYETYSVLTPNSVPKTVGDLQHSEFTDTKHHKDYLCNKCVTGKELQQSIIFGLISLSIAVSGIFLIALDYFSENAFGFVLFFTAASLFLSFCNLRWFIDVLTAISTGKQYKTKWYHGLGLFLFGNIINVSTADGNAILASHLKKTNPDRYFMHPENYESVLANKTNPENQ